MSQTLMCSLLGGKGGILRISFYVALMSCSFGAFFLEHEATEKEFRKRIDGKLTQRGCECWLDVCLYDGRVISMFNLGKPIDAISSLSSFFSFPFFNKLYFKILTGRD